MIERLRKLQEIYLIVTKSTSRVTIWGSWSMVRRMINKHLSRDVLKILLTYFIPRTLAYMKYIYIYSKIFQCQSRLFYIELKDCMQKTVLHYHIFFMVANKKDKGCRHTQSTPARNSWKNAISCSPSKQPILMRHCASKAPEKLESSTPFM